MPVLERCKGQSPAWTYDTLNLNSNYIFLRREEYTKFGFIHVENKRINDIWQNFDSRQWYVTFNCNNKLVNYLIKVIRKPEKLKGKLERIEKNEKVNWEI